MRKYQLIVSEPFDFIGPFGNNTLIGSIIRNISPKALIFKSDKVIDFKSYKGDTFLLQPRYVDDSFDYFDMPRISVGAGMLLTENYQTMELGDIQLNSKYLFIGPLISI